jgi:hypothetical protein
MRLNAQFPMRRRFDFEIGYLIKSPCKTCIQYDAAFPQCAEQCAILDRIHTALAPAISCSCSNGTVESTTSLHPGWNGE